MKKLIALTLTFLLFVCGIVALQANMPLRTVFADTDVRVIEIKGEDEKFSICITGEATKNVSPDKATIYASIETLDTDVKKSKDENLALFEKVLAALSEAGVEKEDIIFEGFSSYPNYDYSCGKSVTGYRSTTSFSVSLNDLGDISSVIGILTENGVTSIRHINYEISNLDEVYQDVLSQALENAKLKAQKFTQRDDIKIVSVREEEVYSCTSLYRDYGDTFQDNATIGQLNIKARVVVNFE